MGYLALVIDATVLSIIQRNSQKRKFTEDILHHYDIEKYRVDGMDRRER